MGIRPLALGWGIMGFEQAFDSASGVESSAGLLRFVLQGRANATPLRDEAAAGQNYDP